ncbi:28S ribosomal protein S31, mitochondrial [Anthonomus grandis grandis]|uniref:28S ribosomal protein S31, mitochondrial n=1 Tax=Anthonomus grandis grandis TaxID=2921223 RepID=UPI0021657034|nr:28S ribosomal protein S31, mitochondrial [Anthonomus grandis grandis]
MNLAQIVLRKCSNSPKSLLFGPTSVLCSKYSQKSPEKGASDSSSDSSSSESDDENQKPNQSDASARLNTLLQQMLQDDTTKSKNTLKLARPVDQRALKQKEKTATEEPFEKQIVTAVGEVAETLGGNKLQTESELLTKLLNPTESSNMNVKSLSDVLKGMKIEREDKPGPSRAEQVRSVLQKFRPSQQGQERSRGRPRPKQLNISSQGLTGEKVDLWNGESLGIFTNVSELKDSPQNETWQKLYQKDLKLAVTHPPSNYFQEMILWTEQGKLWQFPINNEFGLEEESQVYFAEHVFLEEHLEPWCPPRGPIRRFMELVCVGLSKNSYLTVTAKKEHIEWYKNYFEDKKKILQEVGALQVDGEKKSIAKD